MSQEIHILSDFTQGELSPKMKGRFDLQAYYKGAQEITNMIPFFPGGVTYRPGFLRVGAAKGTGRVRLHPFIVSRSLAYVLEIGSGYIRFWKDGSLLMDGETPTEVTSTGWGTGTLEGLQFAQAESMLFIASGTTPVKILAYTGSDDFTFYDLGKIIDGTPHLIGNEGMVPFQGSANYPRAIAFHDGRLYLASSSAEPQTIWASKNDGLTPWDFTYFETIETKNRQLREPVNTFTGTTTVGSTTVTGVATTETTGEGVNKAKLQIGDKVIGTGIPNKDAVSFVGATTSGSAVISNVSSGIIAQLAVGEAITGQNIPATTILSLGANSITLSVVATGTSATNTFERAAKRSYIESVGTTSIVLTQKATAAGTVTLVSGWHDPTVPEYEEITTSRDIVTSASAFKKAIASDQNEQILWLASGRDLVVGTTTGERIIPSGANAVNFTSKRQTAIGSAPVQPFLLNEAVIFVESSGRGAREYLYNQGEGAYQSPCLTALADHVLKGTGGSSEVREADYQNAPIPIAWFTLEDGTVVGCSYSRLYQMAAWFRITTTGTIESIAVVPGTNEDTLYASIRRGSAVNIEVLGTMFGTNGHLDAAEMKVKTAGWVTGLSLANGAAVAVHAGIAYPITVASGSATLNAAIPNGASVLIGLPFTGRLQTMPPNTQAKIGSGQMRAKTVPRLTARLLASYPFKVGFKVGFEDGTLEEAEFTGPATGDYPIPVMGTWDTEGAVVIVQDEPFDLTVLAIAIETDAGG